MNSKQMRAALACHLRYKMQCSLFAFERGLGGDNPDVIGVLPNRYLAEIEIKVSLSDFKRDAAKKKWSSRYHVRPRLFYYAVPPELVAKVTPLLPKGAGLLTFQTIGRDPITRLPGVEIMKKPTADREAKQITLKDFHYMARHLSGTACSVLLKHYAEPITPQTPEST